MIRHYLTMQVPDGTAAEAEKAALSFQEVLGNLETAQRGRHGYTRPRLKMF